MRPSRPGFITLSVTHGYERQPVLSRVFEHGVLSESWCIRRRESHGGTSAPRWRPRGRWIRYTVCFASANILGVLQAERIARISQAWEGATSRVMTLRWVHSLSVSTCCLFFARGSLCCESSEKLIFGSMSMCRSG